MHQKKYKNETLIHQYFVKLSFYDLHLIQRKPNGSNLNKSKIEPPKGDCLENLSVNYSWPGVLVIWTLQVCDIV
jgi:hypothetical protein